MGRKAQVRFLGGWARATASGNPTDQKAFFIFSLFFVIMGQRKLFFLP